MGLLLADCPRCPAKSITFDIEAQVYLGRRDNWQDMYEAFGVCRHCSRPTVFKLAIKGSQHRDQFSPVDGLLRFNGSINYYFEIEGYVSVRDNNPIAPPEHLPKDIEQAFREAAMCLAIGCHNAAGTMFRLCLDLATRPLLPGPDDGGPQPNSKQRRDLGLRLPWLFEQGRLPRALEELAGCIKEDGNDGAHAGTLTKHDAEDLLEFTERLLEELFTHPKRIELSKERRTMRRSAAS